MHPIAWAVPRRSPCSSYSSERPRALPSPNRSRIRWPCHPMRLAISRTPAAPRASSVSLRNGLPATGRMGFGRFAVRGLMRVPSPAARTTAFMQRRLLRSLEPRNISDELIEGPLRNERHQACGGIDAVGAERRLREDPGPRGLSTEVRATSLQFRGDVDVSHAGPPNLRLRKKVLEDHRRVHRDN